MLAEMNVDDDPDFSEICFVGGELTEFSVRRFGADVRRLDLSFNSISRLKGLEICAESLEEVVLDNNQLENIDLETDFPKLNTLSLNKNKILNLARLINNLKSNAPNLRYLSLLGNPICPDQLTDDYVDESDYQIYRYHVLYHLRNLRFLDHRQVTHKESIEAHKSLYGNLIIQAAVNPLPSKKVSPGADRSRQGKRKYKYLGKNSEGNRFIQDGDL